MDNKRRTRNQRRRGKREKRTAPVPIRDDQTVMTVELRPGESTQIRNEATAGRRRVVIIGPREVRIRRS